MPFHKRGLPIFQSEITSHPNMYFLVCSGFVRISQTFEAGAFDFVDFSRTSFFAMAVVSIYSDIFKSQLSFCERLRNKIFCLWGRE